MSLRKLAGETAIYGVSSVLGRLLNFVLLTPFISRVLSGAEFGYVGDLFFFIAFFIALLVFRMDTVVFRFASRAEFSASAVCKRAQSFIWVGVLLWLGLGMGLADYIAGWMQYPDRKIYIQLFVLIVAFDVLVAVPLARLRLEQRPWFFAGVNLVNIFTNLCLTYLLLYYIPRWIENGHTIDWYDDSYKIAYYFFAILVAGVIRYLFLLVDRLRSNRASTKQRHQVLDNQDTPNQELSTGLTSPSIGEMFRYASPLVIVAVCGIINTLVGPSMLIDYLSGTQEENAYWAGQYNAAMKMAVFLSLFTTAYNFAAEPFFFRQRSQDIEGQDLTVYAKATRAFALVCCLAIAAILLLLPILKYYLGEELREGLVVLPILMAANFLLALYYNFAMAYKLTDRTYLGGLIALGGSAIVLLGNIFFIPSLSIYAPAIASLCCFTFMTLCAWIVSRKYFPVPYEIGRITLYALLTCGVVAVGWPLESILLRGLLLVIFTLGLIGFEWKWLKSL